MSAVATKELLVAMVAGAKALRLEALKTREDLKELLVNRPDARGSLLETSCHSQSEIKEQRADLLEGWVERQRLVLGIPLEDLR